MDKVKSGVKTSEFWVSVVGLLTGGGYVIWEQLQARCNFDMPFLMTVAGVVIAYVLGRSWVKARTK